VVRAATTVRRSLGQLVSVVPSVAVDTLARVALEILCEAMAGERTARGIIFVATTADIGEWAAAETRLLAEFEVALPDPVAVPGAGCQGGGGGRLAGAAAGGGAGGVCDQRVWAGRGYAERASDGTRARRRGVAG
jgi:hypothetical protein